MAQIHDKYWIKIISTLAWRTWLCNVKNANSRPLYADCDGIRQHSVHHHCGKLTGSKGPSSEFCVFVSMLRLTSRLYSQDSMFVNNFIYFLLGRRIKHFRRQDRPGRQNGSMTTTFTTVTCWLTVSRNVSSCSPVFVSSSARVQHAIWWQSHNLTISLPTANKKQRTDSPPDVVTCSKLLQRSSKI